MIKGINTYEMGLFSVDRFRSTQNNYNLTTKQYCLRNHQNYLPNNLSKINTLLLNVMAEVCCFKGLQCIAASPFY